MDFSPFELFAVLVLEDARRGQFAVARRMDQCNGERSIWRHIEAFPLRALETFHTLHLQPTSVVITDVDAVKRGPLDQGALDKAGRRTACVEFGGLGQRWADRQRACRTREICDLLPQQSCRPRAHAVHGRCRGLLGRKLESAILDKDQ